MTSRPARAGIADAKPTSPSVRPTAPRRPAVRRRAAAPLPADLGLALVGAAFVESLESRQMLDGIVQSGNTITLAGNATVANAFAITVANNVLTTKVNAKTSTFAYSTSLKLNVVGGSAADTLATAAASAIAMNVVGNGGNDSLQTGAGNDTVNAGDGADSVDGGAGADVVSNAETLVNVETGYAGNQITRVGSVVKVNGNATSANTITVTFDAAAKTILVKCNANVATYSATGITFFSINGGSAADVIAVDGAFTLGLKISGNGGGDSIVGGGGADILYGNDGNDTIDGGAGNDIVDGGAGTDSAVNGETVLNVESKSGTTTTTTPTTPVTPPTTVDGAGAPVVGAAASPVARIVAVSATSITAGQAVHVDGLTSTLNAGQVTTARFEWDFGDAAGKYNELVGFNAAHVYDRAGTYTVTLTVLNEGGKRATTTMRVVVAADARPTIYVSAAGNDANDGATANTAVRTVDRAIALLGKRSDVRVLFRRGDTFGITKGLWIYGDDVAIGAYGTGGADPALKYTGPRSWFYAITADANTTGATIDDITFDSVFASTTNADSDHMPAAVWTSANNTLVRGCTFLNVNYAILVSPDASGTLAQGNSAPLASGLRSYFMFVQGRDVVALGNTIVNSTREHVFRSVNGTRMLVSDNTFTNLDRTAVDPGDIAKSVINLQVGSYAYVVGNTLDGNVAFGPLETDAMLPYKTQRLSYGVFEANHQIGGILQFKHGAEHMMVRNNVLDSDGSTLIHVDGYDAAFARGVADLSILNNTGINDSTHGNFLTTYSPVDGIRLLDNLYVAPNLVTGSYNTSPVLVYDNDLSNFTAIDDNNWGTPTADTWAQGGVNWVGTAFVSASYQTPAEWNALAGVGTDRFVDVTLKADFTPVGPDAVVNGGDAIGGVFTDYYGEYRSAADWTIGAVQA